MRNRTTIGCMAVAIGMAWLATPASAQPARSAGPGMWEIEFHGAGVFSRGAAGGEAPTPFPEGTPIPSGGGMRGTGPALNSRAVSSWYFGDGARLLNEASAGLGIPSRITPLDQALTRRIAQRRSGGGFGVRVSRRLTSRLAAELSVDDHRTPVKMTGDARSAIETSRSTFVTAWQGLLATGATFNRQVTSDSVLEEGDGHEVLVTGAVTVDVGRVGRAQPYVVAGAGGVFRRGTLPSATLSGRYRFDFASVFPMDETDAVTVRAQASDSSFVTVFGGGVKLALSARHGLRVDARVHVTPDRDGTRVDAVPSVAEASPAFAVSTPNIPNIQFSNNPSTGRQSSLSGPAVSDLQTFAGSGVRLQVALSVGYSLRF